MKILTRFILLSFLRPFTRSFAVSLFLLVLQFLSRYKDDLFGKGLDTDVILKIFGYASVQLAVLALPVSVLLASLFTTGTFGEQYELAAMRSGGMSVRRILKPMLALTLVISMISFALAAYIVPVTNLKLYSLIYDVQQLKPEFTLRKGHFNTSIDNYVIRIEDKDIAKEMLYEVMIYDHTDGKGNDRVIVADSGFMKVDPYGRFMNMWLFNGASYETIFENKNTPKEKESFVRFYFKALFYNFDISGFNLERTSEDAFASHHYMLNLTELISSMDSVGERRDTILDLFASRIEEESKIDSVFKASPDTTKSIPPDDLLLTFPKPLRVQILMRAIQNTQKAQAVTSKASVMVEEQVRAFREFDIEFHSKFSLPMACIIFLFIGAPLGAVVRKGGVGLPIIVSVVFYLAFYVVMIQGKKMAVEGVLPVWTGVWLPVLLMAPLAFLFSFQAASNRSLRFSLVFWALRKGLQDVLVFLLRPIFRRFGRKKKPEQKRPFVRR